MSVPETKEGFIQSFADFITAPPGILLEHYCGDKDLASADRRAASWHRSRALGELGKAREIPYDPETLGRSTREVFSGRLQYQEDGSLEYTPGQNYPTEYRWAAYRVLVDYNNLAKEK